MFSVVVPVFNHRAYLQSAVESALRSPLVTEILLVDDGSADGSAALVKQLSQHYGPVVREVEGAAVGNQGAHYRLNELCRNVTGSWIAVLNSDDEFFPSRFDIIRNLIRHERAEFVTGAMLVMDEASRILGTKRGPLEPEYPLPIELRGLTIRNSNDLMHVLCSQNVVCTTSNMVFSKDLFWKLKGFRDLRYTHDWDFALRATLVGRTAFSNHPLTRYRAHARNTIKEPSPHVDGEVVRLFSWILDENPEFTSDRMVRAALRSNEHLGRAPWLQRESASATLRGIALQNSEDGVGAAVPGDEKHDDCEGAADTAVDVPDCIVGLGRRAVANVTLALAQPDYSFVVVSEGLDELPSVAIGRDADSTHAAVATVAGFDIAHHPSDVPIKGRLIRHPSGKGGAPGHRVDIRSIAGFAEARWEGADIFLGHPAEGPPLRLAARETALAGIAEYGTKSTKPRCLVLPTFMATGGVERNTIEVLRCLRNRYDFVVVTSERLQKHQGSLHHQLDELDIPCLDLGEIANADRHLAFFAGIKASFQPDIIYICNGSSWLMSHAERFRQVFSGAAIVDQQVYDTKIGWITSYGHRGIQSFNRFIATNGRIRREFTSRILIPENRVDLIYPCINSKQLANDRMGREDQVIHRAKMGLAEDQLVFAYLGRLTSQKRPLDFLDLALRAKRSGLGDRFFLVGDGELAEDCDRFIRANDLENVTRIQRYDNVADIGNAVDGLIILSSYEGLPIVLLETLALGKPALATDVGDIALVLEEHKCGLIIKEAGDLDENWKKFQAFRGELPTLTERAQEARHQILDKFSAEVISEQYHTSWMRAMRQAELDGCADVASSAGEE